MAVPRLEIGTRTALSGGLAKRRERARMAITRRGATTVHQPNLSEKIDRLSVVGRQCVAVICLERFCRKYRLTHPAITKFIDHVWKVTQVDPETFGEWAEGFSLMPITGQGDPYKRSCRNDTKRTVERIRSTYTVRIRDERDDLVLQRHRGYKELFAEGARRCVRPQYSYTRLGLLHESSNRASWMLGDCAN